MSNIIAKYRCLYGNPVYKNQSYENLNISDTFTEGNMLCANEKYIAVPWKSGGGGSVHVRKIEQFGKI